MTDDDDLPAGNLNQFVVDAVAETVTRLRDAGFPATDLATACLCVAVIIARDEPLHVEKQLYAASRKVAMMTATGLEN